ncbi:MAG: hypothetical protein ACP5NV_00890 [Candidatus Woesearchaeota archaeon]
MIQLTKDLFAHLALSAKSLKEERMQRELHPRKTELSELEKTSFETVRPIKIAPLKTMEETIEEVVENPKIIALKKELSIAEDIFEKLKVEGENLDFIDRIENKIVQLKKMIDQKSY